MNPLDEQIEALIAMISANGGVAGIDPNAPDYVKRAFLEMILGCKDCRDDLGLKHDGKTN